MKSTIINITVHAAKRRNTLTNPDKTVEAKGISTNQFNHLIAVALEELTTSQLSITAFKGSDGNHENSRLKIAVIIPIRAFRKL